MPRLHPIRVVRDALLPGCNDTALGRAVGPRRAESIPQHVAGHHAGEPPRLADAAHQDGLAALPGLVHISPRPLQAGRIDDDGARPTADSLNQFARLQLLDHLYRVGNLQF